MISFFSVFSRVVSKNFSRVLNYKLSGLSSGQPNAIEWLEWFCIFLDAQATTVLKRSGIYNVGAFISHFKYSTRVFGRGNERGSRSDLLFIRNLKKIGMKLTAQQSVLLIKYLCNILFIFLFRSRQTRQKATKCQTVPTIQINCSMTGLAS